MECDPVGFTEMRRLLIRPLSPCGGPGALCHGSGLTAFFSSLSEVGDADIERFGKRTPCGVLYGTRV